MKKDLLKIGLLSLTLITISSIVILFFGKTYTVSFVTNNDNHETILMNEDGEVQIIEEKKVDNYYFIKLKSIKPGKVFLALKYDDDFQESKVLYVHKTMIITDNTYFGKSTYSEIIPISLFIILSYTLYLLIQKYRYSIKENLYQYKNIAYLGIIIFIVLFIVSIIRSIFNYQGLYNTINNVINSLSYVSFILFPSALITFILVTISNIRLIRKEGLSLRNLLGLIFGIFICFSTWLPDIVYGILQKSQKIDIYNLNSMGAYLYNFVESLVYLTISYLECILIGTIVIAIKSIRNKPKYNKDYMIILGCKIKKDGTLPTLLKGRVDRAIAFRNEQLDKTGKDLIFIPSGGKGNDEVIAEAEAMKNYLLGEGIKEKNILIENKSKNTFQNIKFSNALIKERNANICFSTTNYHVLRAGLIATEQGLKLEGIGSKTKVYFWVNAFIREFIGTLYSERKKHIVMIIIIIVMLIIMISITYIANNI